MRSGKKDIKFVDVFVRGRDWGVTYEYKNRKDTVVIFQPKLLKPRYLILVKYANPDKLNIQLLSNFKL